MRIGVYDAVCAHACGPSYTLHEIHSSSIPLQLWCFVIMQIWIGVDFTNATSTLNVLVLTVAWVLSVKTRHGTVRTWDQLRFYCAEFMYKVPGDGNVTDNIYADANREDAVKVTLLIAMSV